ncbi:monovalent cation:H+ antiporter, CPA1 (nhx1) [Malassezia sp. CBS 17886]|nr:monovalent cation:H+ antiporter, CPA1 (nhx1) [Malassezia sp. CBS 17886]
MDTAAFSAAQSGTAPLGAEENERFSSMALFLVMFLLIGSFLTSYYLKVKRITAVHETIVGLFAGMFVGIVLRLGPLRPVREMLSFSNTIMLNVLLPPIILSSGYDMRQAKFFRNFGTILTFAFFGTVISAVVIGCVGAWARRADGSVVVWFASLLRLESLRVSLLEGLIFGSTLSATDPVTILAIFNTYQVDPQLYSIIFGESILNDAVSIVMFETLSKFRNTEITAFSVVYGVGIFLVVFSLSVLAGACFGLVCSLLLKHTRLGTYPELESCIVLLIAYTSYFFSNAVELSGIVSLLFCGITLKHYAYHSMSLRTQRTSKYIFHMLASLSENFIFIYLGLSLFTGEHLVFQPLLILFTLAAVVASRYCAVFPIAWALNQLAELRARQRLRSSGGGGPPEGAHGLPRAYQLMLFWAGLRGAVGFALSAGIEGANASALQTTVLVAVVLTVIVFGGTTAQMLDVLQIQTGVQDNEDDASVGDLDEEDDARSWMAFGAAPFRLAPNASASAVAASRAAPRSRRGSPAFRYRDASGPLGLAADADAGVPPPDSPSAPAHVDPANGDEVLPAVSADAAMPHAVVAGPGGLRSLTNEELEEDAEHARTDATGGHRPRRALLDRANVIFQDGQWFQRMDERYLLPMFSNAVASRRHEQRKESRQARRSVSRGGEGGVWAEGWEAAAPCERDAEEGGGAGVWGQDAPFGASWNGASPGAAPDAPPDAPPPGDAPWSTPPPSAPSPQPSGALRKGKLH